jgi:hypothetical protein
MQTRSILVFAFFIAVGTLGGCQMRTDQVSQAAGTASAYAFECGFPTADTVRKGHNEADLNRAIEASSRHSTALGNQPILQR